MNVQRMRTYFLYSLPMHRKLRSEQQNELAVAVTPQDIELFDQYFSVEPGPVPAFYTSHYRQTHTPYLLTDANCPQISTIPLARLQSIPFFAGIDLRSDLRIEWSVTL